MHRFTTRTLMHQRQSPPAIRFLPGTRPSIEESSQQSKLQNLNSATETNCGEQGEMDIAMGIEGAVTLRVQAWWRRPVTQFRRAHDDPKATQPVVGTHPKIAIFVVVACFTALSLDWR